MNKVVNLGGLQSLKQVGKMTEGGSEKTKEAKSNTKYLLIGIGVILVLIIAAILFNSDIFQSTTKVSEKTKKPSYITQVDGQNALKVDADEFKAKVKNKINISSGLDIKEVNKDGEWLKVSSRKVQAYANSLLYFTTESDANLVSIERCGDNIKSITWLSYITGTGGTVVEESVINTLKEMGIDIVALKNENKLEENFEMTTYTVNNAIKDVGYYAGYSELQINVYRQNLGKYFYIPYPYNKSTSGIYVTLRVK